MPTHGVQHDSLSTNLINVGSSIPGTTKRHWPGPGLEDHPQNPLLQTITSFISVVQKHLHTGFPVSPQDAGVVA